jgi:hypothetical protein
MIFCLHGVLRRALNPVFLSPSAVVSSDIKAPLHLRDFAEGGTLAYLIRLGGRKVLAFGSMNYIEREVEGLRPDVALIAAKPERREIFEYTPRLLRALEAIRPWFCRRIGTGSMSHTM